MHGTTRSHSHALGRDLPARARAAFTMIELMLVVTILGLVTYAVSLGFDALVPGERLNTSVRDLASTLQGTRSDAIAQNAEYFVQYDLEGERYRVITPFKVGGGRFITGVDREEERWNAPWQELRTGVEFASVAIAGEIYSLGSDIYVRFDPLGGASDHSVILTQPKFESFYTIEVLSLNGLIRFHEGEYFREPPDEGDFQN